MITSLNELRLRRDRKLFDTPKEAYVMSLGGTDRKCFESLPGPFRDIWSKEFCPVDATEADGHSANSLPYSFDHYSRDSIRFFDAEKVMRLVKVYYKKAVQQDGKCSRELRDRD